VRSKALTFVIIVVGLGVAGAILGHLATPVWVAAQARQPALRLESTTAAAGQGLTLALLGGFRALVADAAWLQMYTRWERRDLPGCETLLRLVGSLDPRPLYFWLNGARIMAYDFTAWRIVAAGGYESVAAAEQERVGREQAHLALRHLDAAMQFHPASADLWIERANVQLRVGDLAAAADSYRRAWEQPNAPFYAARLHAEMLRRLGRKREALAWLVQLHPQLPPDVPAAAADVVRARIDELERELAVPAGQRYRVAR
jgi:hypothetical protein